MKTEQLLSAFDEVRTAWVNDAETAGIQRKPVRRVVLRQLLAAALTLLLISAFPVMVYADVRPAYELMYDISPELAQRLKPVNKSSISNGIKMEVISVQIVGDQAEICVSVQDLKYDRIDETVDLFDSYSIRQPYDSSASCQMLKYDAATKTAYFLIRIEQWANQPFEGKKITFSVDQLLTQKTITEGDFPQVDLTRAERFPKVRTQAGVSNGSAGTFRLLEPETTPLYTFAEGADLYGMGFVDGKLHMLLGFSDVHQTDNHGYVRLIGANGAASVEEVAYSSEQAGKTKNSFTELIFDVSPSELEQYRLYGYFVTCGTLVEGDWSVTFPLENEAS